MTNRHPPTSPACQIACPKCHASPGQHCRTLFSQRVTDVHKARYEARYPTSTPTKEGSET